MKTEDEPRDYDDVLSDEYVKENPLLHGGGKSRSKKKVSTAKKLVSPDVIFIQ